jgi:Fic family protein
MHVEIRRIANKRKYYLAHSIRRGAAVKKFRVYLGADLSKTDLKLRRERAAEVVRARMRQAERIRDPFHAALTPVELKEVMTLEARAAPRVHHLTEQEWKRFTQTFTYDTNAIEGSTVTVSEVGDILERRKWPKVRSKDEISETYGLAEAVTRIRKTKERVSLKLMKDLHKTVFKNSKTFAGRFRKLGVEVAVMDASGHTVHVGAPSESVVPLLRELVLWYDKNKIKYPPILLAAVVHNQFETIHPFQDGNGRVGRLLLNNVLLKHNLPPVNIRLKNRQEYYRALQEYQSNRNIRPTIELILKEYRDLRRIIKRGG